MSTLIGSIFVFLLVIALHEFGHFSIAKLVGIKVNEFSIGMGPNIYSKIKGETKYSLRALPIGGYVAMEGEEMDSEDPRAFNNVSVPKRMAVVVAGAMMNFILAIIAFSLAMFIMGIGTTTIDKIEINSPAEIAGLLPRDEIISIDGKEIQNWEEIVERIANSNGTVKIDFLRNGKEHSKEIPTIKKEGRQIIGITPVRSHNMVKSIFLGFSMVISTIVAIFQLFKIMFSGGFSLDMLSGPVGVIQVIGESTKSGFGSLLYVLGFISANLGFMNLLPIPALDGGKLVFLAIEGIRGKPISEKIEVGLSVIGIVLLMGLMLYVTIFSDIERIIGS